MSFACTTPTTLSTEPSHTTKRECGADFNAAAMSRGGSVRSIQADLGARRHDRAHRLVGQPQHALDHVALLAFQHAGLRALGQQRLQLLLRDRLRAARGAGRAGAAPRRTISPAARPRGRRSVPSRRSGGATRRGQSPGRRSASCLGTSSPSTRVR